MAKVRFRRIAMSFGSLVLILLAGGAHWRIP
jgi:hypothetical protein